MMASKINRVNNRTESWEVWYENTNNLLSAKRYSESEFAALYGQLTGRNYYEDRERMRSYRVEITVPVLVYASSEEEALATAFERLKQMSSEDLASVAFTFDDSVEEGGLSWRDYIAQELRGVELPPEFQE